MKNCDEIRNMIYGYIDKELDEIESAEFESHIKDCQECRNELDETKRLMDICRDMPEEELPQDFRKGLHDKLLAEKHIIESKQKTTYIVRKYLAICSTVAAVLVIAIIVKGLPWNSPVVRQNLHSQNKTAYKNHAEARTWAAPESPTYTSNDKANIEKNGSTSKSAEKSKSQSTSGYSTQKSKNTVPSAANIPASNEKKVAESGNKGTNEPKQSKKASKSDSDQINRMMALGAQEDYQTYQLKNVNISMASANQTEDIEKIKSNFLSYGAELITEAADETSNGENTSLTSTSNSTELKIKVPNASYQQFIDYLKNNFSSEEVEIGELNVVDVTGQIKDYQDKADVLSAGSDNAGSAANNTNQADDKKTGSDLQKVQNEMNELKNESEYTIVVITFKD